MMFLTASSSKHVIVLIEMQSRDHTGQKQCLVSRNNSQAAAGLGLICRLRWLLRLSRFQSFNLFFWVKQNCCLVVLMLFSAIFLNHRNLSSFSESQFLWSRVCVKEGRVIDWMKSVQTQQFFQWLTAPVTKFKSIVSTLKLSVTFRLLETVSVLRWIIRNFV